MTIIYPDVPNVAGVPALPRNPLFPPTPPPILLTQDAISTPQSVPAQKWGLYSQGEPVILADNVIEIEYKQNWAIADYQMEEGAFESYDKVSNPFEIALAFSCGGSIDQRQQFLDSIKNIAGDLNLYDVYTPEENYLNVNISHYDYKRTATNGMGLIVVNIYVQQIRITTTSPFNNTTNVGSNARVNDGVAQTTTITDPLTIQTILSGANTGS